VNTKYIIHFRGHPVAIKEIDGAHVAILPAEPTPYQFMSTAMLHAESAGLDMAQVKILPVTK
jgi:hypothetical protein